MFYHSLTDFINNHFTILKHILYKLNNGFNILIDLIKIEFIELFQPLTLLNPKDQPNILKDLLLNQFRISLLLLPNDLNNIDLLLILQFDL